MLIKCTIFWGRVFGELVAVSKWIIIMFKDVKGYFHIHYMTLHICGV